MLRQVQDHGGPSTGATAPWDQLPTAIIHCNAGSGVGTAAPHCWCGKRYWGLPKAGFPLALGLLSPAFLCRLPLPAFLCRPSSGSTMSRAQHYVFHSTCDADGQLGLGTSRDSQYERAH